MENRVIGNYLLASLHPKNELRTKWMYIAANHMDDSMRNRQLEAAIYSMIPLYSSESL